MQTKIDGNQMPVQTDLISPSYDENFQVWFGADLNPPPNLEYVKKSPAPNRINV